MDYITEDDIRDTNKLKLWTAIALSIFELEKRSKAQNVWNWTGYQKFVSVSHADQQILASTQSPIALSFMLLALHESYLEYVVLAVLRGVNGFRHCWELRQSVTGVTVSFETAETSIETCMCFIKHFSCWWPGTDQFVYRTGTNQCSSLDLVYNGASIVVTFWISLKVLTHQVYKEFSHLSTNQGKRLQFWYDGIQPQRLLSIFLFCIRVLNTYTTYDSFQLGMRYVLRCQSTWIGFQNCRHFAEGTFKCIFFNENVWISFGVSLKFVPRVRINNIPALVQIMA